jgi:hypothetical protein
MGQVTRRGGPRERKGKRKKENKVRENKKERKGKGQKFNWEFLNLENYGRKIKGSSMKLA